MILASNINKTQSWSFIYEVSSMPKRKCLQHFTDTICAYLSKETKRINSIIPFILYYNIGIRKVKSIHKQLFSPKRVHIFHSCTILRRSYLSQYSSASATLSRSFLLCVCLQDDVAIFCRAVDKWVLWAVLSTASRWSLKNFLRFSSSLPPPTISSVKFSANIKTKLWKIGKY